MGNYSILIVDDEDLIRESLGFDLKRKGYEVTLAKSGEEAIDKLDSSYYDIIITDLNMEGLTGIDVLQKAKDKTAEAIVFILTGQGNIDSAVEAMRLGATDYMFKPFEKANMFLRISNCIKKLELQKKVKLSENIIETSQSAIISIDEDGLIIGWNKAAEELFGYSKQEIMQLPVTELTPKKYRNPTWKEIDRFLSAGKVARFVGLKKDGFEVPIELSVTVQMEQKGNKIFTAIVSDITDRKKLEKSLDLSFTRMESLNRMQQVLIGPGKTKG